MAIWQSSSSTLVLQNPPLVQATVSEDVQRIVLDGSLFGIEVVESDGSDLAKSTQVSIENIQESRLNLTLKGVIITPEKSIALIDNGRTVLILGVDDEISNNISIKQIFDSYLIVSNKGVLEKLALPEVKLNLNPSAVAKSPQLSSEQLDKLKQFKQQMQTSPLTISRYIRVRTIQKDGKIEALQLWPRQEKAIFDALGFRSGDRLTAVNGRPVADLANDPKQWQSMMNLSQASFTVSRNGSEQVINVNLQ